MKRINLLLMIFFKKGTLNILTYLKYFLVPFFVFSLFSYLPAQESKVWDYPVHYGTQEWEKLSTFQERLKAYNIPSDLLQYMTTEDLVKTSLTYPDWLLITASNNFQIGYNSIRSVFNGFVELEKRPDAFKELIKVYKEMNPEEITQQSKKGQFTFEFTFIELILSQKSILSTLSNSELTSLIKTCLSIYEKKCKFIDIFSTFGLSTTCLILGRLLEQGNLDPYINLKSNTPEVQKFIEEGPFGPHKLLLDKIVTASREYLEQR